MRTSKKSREEGGQLERQGIKTAQNNSGFAEGRKGLTGSRKEKQSGSTGLETGGKLSKYDS
jgi:hypothetical protein